MCSVVAFFDLDGTLVGGQTQALLIRYMYAKGLLSRRVVLASGLWFVGYRIGLLRATDAAREKGSGLLAGMSRAEVRSLMEKFSDEVLLPRLHRPAVGALERHQQAGDRVVILSAALEPLVEAFAGRLGVTDYVGAACAWLDSRLTGRLSGPPPMGEQKAEVAARLALGWGVDLEECWAYADSESDLYLLRAVGHPVAVRPKSKLAAAARAARWQVMP